MKLEIKKTDDGVEIHLMKDDGSKTVWLCEDETAAFYKLSSLVFSTAEDQKQSKRSILISEYGPEKAPDKEPLSKRAERLRERLAKELPQKQDEAAQIVPSTIPAADPSLQEILEILKSQKTTSPYKYPLGTPQIIPQIGPQVPSYPYIGDFPGLPQIDVWTHKIGTGGTVYGAIGHSDVGGMEVINCSLASKFEDVPFKPSKLQMFYGNGGVALAETPMGTSIDINGNATTYFKFGKTG